MKTLYLECNMGAAGDMLMAALYELLPDGQSFIDKMNMLGIPGVVLEAEKMKKCGIQGTHMKVSVYHMVESDVTKWDKVQSHSHKCLPEIYSLIGRLELPEKVKEDAKAVYGLIADAESKVHGQPASEVHFHEVGALDAVADVVGVCLLMDMIAPDEVLASPVHVGCGSVRTMHGILPVPAPATALLLEGIPSYGGQIEGELCTPTGAALLKYFVSRFGERPVMAAKAVGYGMGTKDLERANCLRAFLGEKEGKREEITKLECNLDDMTGEDIGFAMEQLFKEGARDVYTQGIGMKKNRPGVMLSVICLPEDADRLAGVIMKHTTTLGIRRQDMSRYVLERSTEIKDTPYGPVRVKTASGMGVERTKAEYEDIAKLAEENDMSLSEIRGKLKDVK